MAKKKRAAKPRKSKAPAINVVQEVSVNVGGSGGKVKAMNEADAALERMSKPLYRAPS